LIRVFCRRRGKVVEARVGRFDHAKIPTCT
jgi:hypothetical protein